MHTAPRSRTDGVKAAAASRPQEQGSGPREERSGGEEEPADCVQVTATEEGRTLNLVLFTVVTVLVRVAMAA